MGVDYATRARALVGARFRPQGRDPNLGLDCVGLVLAAFGIQADAVRRNYRLRGDYLAEIELQLARSFRPVGKSRPGDLMLLRVAPDQLHFAISTELGFVHADARAGCVVETPGTPCWPVVRTYRMRTKRKG